MSAGTGQPEKPALLVVRSMVLDEADRAGFDRWYATDHMPKALAVLGAEEGWRFWSHTDPSVHVAVYRYRSMAALLDRPALGREKLMAEYEAAWPGVTRTREALEYRDHAVRA